MSKLKATPGPYRIRHSRKNGDVGIMAPNVRNVIAETFEDMRYAYEGNRDEALANAYLLAAAPEMYRKLEQSAKDFRTLAEYLEQKNFPGLASDMRRRADEIDITLSRARGEGGEE